jgi:hypothetical protein
VYAAIQRAPFKWLKQHIAWQIAVYSGQQRRVQDAPTDYGK